MISEDFNTSNEALYSWMLDCSLQDMILIKHGKGHIDFIFGSPSPQISKGWFLSFNRLFSDHRGILICIPKFLIDGFNPQQSLI